MVCLCGYSHFLLQSGQPQPDPGVAVTVGQDTLGEVEGITYSAAAQVTRAWFTIIHHLQSVQYTIVASFPGLLTAAFVACSTNVLIPCFSGCLLRPNSECKTAKYHVT